MFDEDDDMLNQEQTMPWFDPNYLASKENEDVSFKSPHKHNVNALHQVLLYNTFGISIPSLLGACIHILTSYAPSKKLQFTLSVCQYDGDGEQSSFKGGRLRATVDGDAKRPHRDLTDSAAEQESVMELDRSKYLDSYQQSTPMQPGIWAYV